MEIEKNVVLAPLTTFKIGGQADYFCRVRDIADLKTAIEFARNHKLPIFVLGGGSNLVVSDDGYRGMVIKVEISGIEISGQGAVAGAGENWDSFVDLCLSKKLYGLENLSGIPGTVGGASAQNIGAYGVEVKAFIKWVEAVSIETGLIKKFTAEECAYGYRHSFFKTTEGREWVIMRTCFLLSDKPVVNISYKDLSGYFANVNDVSAISPALVRQAVLQIRSRKFPPLDKFGTAGSFFKNPIVGLADAKRLTENFPGLPVYDAGPDKKKISLAWIIDRVCALKGLKIGNVEVSDAQALVLVSKGQASSVHVIALAEKIKSEVKDKTGIDIEFEVESV